MKRENASQEVAGSSGQGIDMVRSALLVMEAWDIPTGHPLFLISVNSFASLLDDIEAMIHDS